MRLRRWAAVPVVGLVAALLPSGHLPAGASELSVREVGELRSTTSLTGDAARPTAGDPDGSGIAVFTSEIDTNEVCYELTVSDIASATSAHLHRGGPDQVEEGETLTLTPPSDGSSSGCATVSDALADDLANTPEAFYVEIHNSEHPSGALRGQLSAQLPPIAAQLNGAQETDGASFHQGDPDARGLAVLSVDEDLSVLCYDVLVHDGDAPTAAHIHQARFGQNGPVVQTLAAPSGAPAQSTECVLPDGSLDLGALVDDPQAFYVNVHTAAHPAGAVRGQLTDDASSYRLTATDGGVFTFGDASFHGSTGGMALNAPVVGMAPTPTRAGYWLVASDGGIFTFGDAGFHGSLGGIPLNQPILGMAPTPTGQGYWLVASDGGVFAFGDAEFHGSTGDIALNEPVVDIAATTSGKGYYLVARDGGVFTFGDASFHGSTGDVDLNEPIAAISVDPEGVGYWFVAEDGGVFAFEAPFRGTLVGLVDGRTYFCPDGIEGECIPEWVMVDLVASPTGLGYLMANDVGEVFVFGDALHFGDVSELPTEPVLGASR